MRKNLPSFTILSNGYPSDADGQTCRWINEIALVAGLPADMALEVQQITEYRYGVAARIVAFV